MQFIVELCVLPAAVFDSHAGCAFRMLALQPLLVPMTVSFRDRGMAASAPQSSLNGPQMPDVTRYQPLLLLGTYSFLTVLVDVLISSDATSSLQPPWGTLPAPTCGSLGCISPWLWPGPLSLFGDICVHLVFPTGWRAALGLI